MPGHNRAPICLVSGGVAVVFDLATAELPSVVYWGRADGNRAIEAAEQLSLTSTPSVMNSSLDAPRAFTIVPTEREGWSGIPGLELRRAFQLAPRLSLVEVTNSGQTAEFTLRDDAAEIEIRVGYELDPFGVLSVSNRITNRGEAPLEVVAARSLLPLPARAAEILDQTGRWSHERVPQRTPVRDGIHHRQVRRGRPGHDSPLLTVVGTPGFGFRHGEVWSSHVAWSGDQEWMVERLPEGAGTLSAVLGGNELLRTGEVRLAPGESYVSPSTLFAWSDEGLDGLSSRFHGYVRAFPSHPATPRPLVLNTWEAVYFDHDHARLLDLAERAASVGVERFVLDDGWFLGRTNDRAGLGDWTVDRKTWPAGLGEISASVHGLGMQFGLWFEPEMVNLDSELAREHPDWILAPNDSTGRPWRHQFVLNLAEPTVSDYLFDSISSLVAEYSIDFLKWDHNRDLHEAVSRLSGAPSAHAQTLATYALLDRLLLAHPGLEIESCASGGARVDLGILRRTHRVWASDTNDPIERQSIQRWTGMLVPPELVGSHVGPSEAHTTHRVSSLQFRLVTALFGHAGIEWDLTRCSDDELAGLHEWAEFYKSRRGLLHAGTTVRADLTDAALALHGIVSHDRSAAIFAFVALASTAVGHSERTLFPGLDPERSYRVRLRPELGSPSLHQISSPRWFTQSAEENGIELSGWLLSTAGVPLPVLNPGSAILLEFSDP
ncbi:MAG: alpha-galactosidase, partial [Microbacteriaceae bacterium]|nr:alpha-galactosidase [Microbacteriaceae bacterium]